MKDRKAIGIIGGMGPEASEKFYGLLIRHAVTEYGIKKNDEFPEIYLASIPVPDFISDKEDMGHAKEMLVDRLRNMENLPIGFYCIACNTGHLLLPDLQKVTDRPFVSLLSELPKVIIQKRLRTVGLLASPTTIECGMYQNILGDRGIQTVIPEHKDITEVGMIIKDTIAGDHIDDNSRRIQEIASRLLKKGAEGIIEGCTEIPIIFPKQYLIPVFDTLEILALAVLKKYYQVQ